MNAYKNNTTFIYNSITKEMNSNCRIYVCRSIFGKCDECIKFDTFEEYKEWLHKSKNNNYTFQPVCNNHYNALFDKCILAMRSGHFPLYPSIREHDDSVP